MCQIWAKFTVYEKRRQPQKSPKSDAYSRAFHLIAAVRDTVPTRHQAVSHTAIGGRGPAKMRANWNNLSWLAALKRKPKPLQTLPHMYTYIMYYDDYNFRIYGILNNNTHSKRDTHLISYDAARPGQRFRCVTLSSELWHFDTRAAIIIHVPSHYRQNTNTVSEYMYVRTYVYTFGAMQYFYIRITRDAREIHLLIGCGSSENWRSRVDYSVVIPISDVESSFFRKNSSFSGCVFRIDVFLADSGRFGNRCFFIQNRNP